MNNPSEFTFDPQHNGVYRVPVNCAALSSAADAQEIEWCDFDLNGVLTKRVFLARCAAALRFPAGFGANWDALADCLEDLSWQAAGGVVVHWQSGGGFARALPKEFMTALAIFTDAATYWRDEGRVMLVLMDENSAGGHVLPAFPFA